jgi:ABC-2 type transport system permease protein
VPAIDQVYRDDFSESVTNSGLENLVGDMSFTHQIASLSMPDLWIGAIAGAAMIFAAIRLRRWRDEG